MNRKAMRQAVALALAAAYAPPIAGPAGAGRASHNSASKKTDNILQGNDGRTLQAGLCGKF